VTNGPVNPKVKAAAAGGGAAGVLSAFTVWGLDELLWNGAQPPEVPGPVVGVVGLAVGAGLSFAAGWLKKDRSEQ
jgi:hypothetical protein